ncbi:MAG: hypothetical protein ACO21V_13600, partial [Limnohabitans sp.]
MDETIRTGVNLDDQHWMGLALEQAREAAAQGEGVRQGEGAAGPRLLPGARGRGGRRGGPGG